MPLVQSILVLLATVLVVLAAVLTYILLALSGGAGVLANRIGQGCREGLVIRPLRPAAAAWAAASPVVPKSGGRVPVPVVAFRGT